MCYCIKDNIVVCHEIDEVNYCKYSLISIVSDIIEEYNYTTDLNETDNIIFKNDLNDTNNQNNTDNRNIYIKKKRRICKFDDECFFDICELENYICWK